MITIDLAGVVTVTKADQNGAPIDITDAMRAYAKRHVATYPATFKNRSKASITGPIPAA